MKSSSWGLLCALLSCACEDQIRGNGEIVEQVRAVHAFSGVRVEDGLQVRVTGGEPALRLVMDENLLEFVESAVRGADLVLRVRDEHDLHPSEGTEILVSAPRLERVSLSDGSDLEGELAGDGRADVDLSASAGSELWVEVAAARVFAAASGGSFLSLDGAAHELVVGASGGSHVESSLPAERLEVEASGGSHVEGIASASASVVASGGSTIVVHGEPGERSVETSGGSSVSFP